MIWSKCDRWKNSTTKQNIIIILFTIQEEAFVIV